MAGIGRIGRALDRLCFGRIFGQECAHNHTGHRLAHLDVLQLAVGYGDPDLARCGIIAAAVGVTYFHCHVRVRVRIERIKRHAEIAILKGDDPCLAGLHSDPIAVEISIRV